MSDQPNNSGPDKPNPEETPPPTGPVTITLSKPITKEGKEITELVIQEPKLKHFEVLDQLKLRIGPEGATIENLGSLAKVGAEKLANLTELEAAELAWPDVFEIAGVVMGFFGLSLPEIGESTSGL